MKLLNLETTYKTLQPFTTIEQLNANTKAIRAQFAKVLSLATRQVLDVLHRYASKYYGVCFLSKNNIADKLGVSKRTVIRACQRLESLGIIAQYTLFRHNGDKRQSSNAIVFVTQVVAREAFDIDVEQVSDNMRKNNGVTPDCHSIDALENALKNNLNTDDTEKAELLKQGLVTKLPKTIQRALAPFFDADKLYELSGVIFKAKAAIDRRIQLEDYETDYYNAILSVINAFKRGKADTLSGLLYSSIKATTRRIKVRQVQKSIMDALGIETQ